MIEEEWRPVVGYEGLYEVSNQGRVRGLDRYVESCYGSYRLQKGKLLKPESDHKGYLKVVLCLNGKFKKYLVHRLVAQAFIPNPDNLPQVNHKDEVKTNNNVDNLEWCDRKYNVNYGTARIRRRDTAIKRGYWTGLSEKEYRRKYREDHRDHINELNREYNKKWREKNKEKIKDYKHQYYLKKKAGL